MRVSIAGTGTCHRSRAKEMPALLVPLPQSGGTSSSSRSLVLQQGSKGDLNHRCLLESLSAGI